MLRKKNNVLLCFMTCAADKHFQHSPQCKFLSSSATNQSGASTMSSKPTTQDRKQLLLWLAALNDAPHVIDMKAQNKGMKRSVWIIHCVIHQEYTLPHWITISERNGMYKTTNGNYMIYKREVSWDECLLWHQHIVEDFKDTSVTASLVS